MKTGEIISSSFRDPSGFVFCKETDIYRQVNIVYRNNYDRLVSSGLYETLVREGLLIPHDEVAVEHARSDNAYKVIKPEPLPFISYPYEWCFSQLLDAAMVTLKIQRKSLDFGMSLKDCSAFNIQFRRGKPIFIDTLSFEKYCEGKPWVAYEQFCQHFLAPLALMCHKDIRLNQLFKVYIDGLPLDLASSLLPLRTYFSFSLLSHIHLHSKSQKHFSDKAINTGDYKIGRLAFTGLIDSLENAIKKLKWRHRNTEWGDYYDNTNYSSKAFQQKTRIITEFLDMIKPKSVWDLGGNIGVFSRLASSKGIETISFDIDPDAVERNYSESVKKGEIYILPLLLDLTNPSPSIGWASHERMSLLERGPADAALALAIVHHLAISNNTPLNKIACFFSKICKQLIIEFAPKSDTQVQRLLSNREDIFPHYNRYAFEEKFSKYFFIKRSVKITDSERILYLMEKR